MGWSTMVRGVVVAAAWLFAQTGVAAVFAKSEFHLGLDLLRHESRNAEADLDEVDIEKDGTSFVAFEPNLRLEAFVDDWYAEIGLATVSAFGGRSSSGRGVLARQMSPTWYVGGVLRYEDRQADVEVKVEGVGNNDSDLELELMQREIGPIALYRDVTGERTLTGFGQLTQVKREVQGASDDAELEVNVDYLALRFGGAYHIPLAPRTTVGFGAAYLMSLNGDAEVEAEEGTAATDQDGDYDLTSLELTLAELMIVL